METKKPGISSYEERLLEIEEEKLKVIKRFMCLNTLYFKIKKRFKGQNNPGVNCFEGN